MQTQNNNGNSNAADFRMIPLGQITPSQTNPRKRLDAESIESLAASIRQQGVLQPILIRPTAEPGKAGASFEIVAGERRYRAAKLASLTDIPSCVVQMSDEEVLQVQIVENLQREDVHPMDEALGYKQLMERAGLDAPEIARRVAKSETYVYQRVKLLDLIESARDAFFKGTITLGHALHLARLQPHDQREGLKHCFEERYGDKSLRPIHVSRLVDWIQQNVMLDLHKAPFKKDDAGLVKQAGACFTCPKRTGFNKGLFADVQKQDTCTDPSCFALKLQAFVQRRGAELAEKTGGQVVRISTEHYMSKRVPDVKLRGEYMPVESKKEQCKHAVEALVVHVTDVGRTRFICFDKSCKDHLGRYQFNTSRTPQEIKAAKEQKLKEKIAREVKNRSLLAIAQKHSHPLPRPALERVANEFFKRIFIDYQKLIFDLYGWREKGKNDGRFFEQKAKEQVAKMTDEQFARFLVLCSIAHVSTSRYDYSGGTSRTVNELAEAAKAAGVNLQKIEEQVKCELSLDAAPLAKGTAHAKKLATSATPKSAKSGRKATVAKATAKPAVKKKAA